VLIGGAVFPLFGALHFWFPKLTGRMYHEGLGKLCFWLLFVGFNVAFFPMHILGLRGMPRRVYTYLPSTGWGDLNMLSTVGSGVIALGVVVFIANAWLSARRGALAGDNPWNADTLDWATSSPPPLYNFLRLPTVSGRYANWDRTPETPVVTGLRVDTREALCTSIVDAAPEHRYELPGPSIWPLVLALATAATFVGVIFTPWAIPAGAVLTFLAPLGWFWHTEPRWLTPEAMHRYPPTPTTPTAAEEPA
jgi:cytochrome c oxidase subunit I+III